MVRLFLILLGTLSLSLGVLGIFVPGLPTTPFLLLSASLYVRSSEKLYTMLTNNRFLGKYIHNYRKNRGLTKRTKIYSLLLMWTMITCSVVFLIPNTYIKIIVLIIGMIGTYVMGFVVKTITKKV